jgi:hypothetical protein
LNSADYEIYNKLSPEKQDQLKRQCKNIYNANFFKQASEATIPLVTGGVLLCGIGLIGAGIKTGSVYLLPLGMIFIFVGLIACSIWSRFRCKKQEGKFIEIMQNVIQKEIGGQKINTSNTLSTESSFSSSNTEGAKNNLTFKQNLISHNQNVKKL